MPENEQLTIKHLVLGLIGIGLVWLFLYLGMSYKESGEHIPVPNRFPHHFPQDATGYCYYRDARGMLCEFNLPQDSFLKYCEKEKWEITEIEKIKEIKSTQEKSLIINRYIKRLKPEHHKCTGSECKIEPTGRTENSCVRFVSKGYRCKKYRRKYAGFIAIYDNENERCYVEHKLR
ncbi:MAG: hypothetical protein LBK82_10415 [Planctomycetaceae bacterium]|jgi:hypothetical protein|nr:hypothetical protein [Planctomycetaceae bacterium]